MWSKEVLIGVSLQILVLDLFRKRTEKEILREYYAREQIDYTDENPVAIIKLWLLLNWRNAYKISME